MSTKFLGMENYVMLALMACMLFGGCGASDSKPMGDPPNILFLFADDYTYQAVRALGNTEIHTPNIDRLITGGTTFTHAYNMGGWNGAICVASRAMIISGRSVWEANAFREHWKEGDSLGKTWGALMKDAGYDTYMTGKWHVDAPPDSVFQTTAHVRPGGMPRDSWNHQGTIPAIDSMLAEGRSEADIRKLGYHRPVDENDTLWSPTDLRFGGYWEGGTHWSEVVKQDAFAFLEQNRHGSKPFFMYLAFNAPHDPRQAPKSYLDQYPLETIALPKSWLPEYPYKDSIGNGPDLRDEALAPFPRTEYAIRKHRQEYYAIISHLDAQIGEIVDRLDALGELENTYIIFTADHGLSVGHHGLLGKQSLFDHSIRVPFVITGPDIPHNKQVDTDIYLQDAMATSLELAGAEAPGYLFFHSLLGLARGTSDAGSYPEIYGAYTDTQRMIRKDGLKLIVYPKLKKTLLFDLEQDPGEMVDVSNREGYRERVRPLFEALVELQHRMRDTLDLTHIPIP